MTATLNRSSTPTSRSSANSKHARKTKEAAAHADLASLCGFRDRPAPQDRMRHSAVEGRPRTHRGGYPIVDLEPDSSRAGSVANRKKSCAHDWLGGHACTGHVKIIDFAPIRHEGAHVRREFGASRTKRARSSRRLL